MGERCAYQPDELNAWRCMKHVADGKTYCHHHDPERKARKAASESATAALVAAAMAWHDRASMIGCTREVELALLDALRDAARKLSALRSAADAGDAAETR